MHSAVNSSLLMYTSFCREARQFIINAVKHPAAFTIDCSEADFLPSNAIASYVLVEKYCAEVLLFFMLAAALMSLSCAVIFIKTKLHEKGFSVKENPENDIYLFDLVSIRGSSAFEQSVYPYLPLC